MPNASHAADLSSVVDRVDNAIESDPETPLHGSTFEFLAAVRTRILCQSLKLRDNSLDDLCWKTIEFLAGRWLQFDFIVIHGACRV